MGAPALRRSGGPERFCAATGALPDPIMISFFYESPDFVGERERRAQGWQSASLLEVHSAVSSFPGLRLETDLRNYGVTESVGQLSGDYVLFEDGLMLLARTGDLIKINHTHQDIFFRSSVDDRYLAESSRERIGSLLDNWDALPLVEDVHVVSHPLFNNYFHFCLELVPKIRFFDDREILIPAHNCSRRYQPELILRCAKPRKVSTYSHPVRVRNPLLAAGFLTGTALAWLRSAYDCKIQSGSRRVYVRRAKRGLSETAEFLRILELHGFETVDFGEGDLTVAEQLSRLDRAGIILSAHGANLVNTIYLAPPLSVIEIVDSRTAISPLLGFVFMLTSSMRGFDHRVLISHAVDESGSLVVDCAGLSQIIGKAVARAVAAAE